MSNFTGHAFKPFPTKVAIIKMCFSAFQARGEFQVDTTVVSENITDFKDQVSSVVIVNLALSLLCGNLVHTVK